MPKKERWSINISDEAQEDLLLIKAYQRPRIRQQIDEVLAYEPFIKTKHRRPCHDVPAQFTHLGVPVWKLTIDPYRILYCLDTAGVLTILLLQVFKKGRKTMEESL